MKWALLLVLCILFSLSGVYFTTHFFASRYRSTENSGRDSIDSPIHILITVCNGGNAKERQSMARYHQVADLLRTIQRYGMEWPRVNCSTSSGGRSGGAICEEIIVHIFTDDVDALAEKFLLVSPTSELIDRLRVRVHAMPRPELETHDYDKYRSCASSRLYAPHLFEQSVIGKGNESEGDGDVPERVLYLDTDALVTTRLRDLWESSVAMFDEHPNALFAMSQECILNPNMGDYYSTGYAGENITGADGNTRHVFTVPKGTCAGYNSGVLFADLRRWQRDNFSEMVAEQESHATRGGYEMRFGDQGILNAMAARFPERLLELPCFWNMRTDSMISCLPRYLENGGGIMHGNRGLFRRNSTPAAVDLHNYLMRDNDCEDPDTLQDLLSRDYDREDLYNDMFAKILEELIVNGMKQNDHAWV